MEELFLRKFSAGDVVFREGEQQNCMYHIRQGKVGIYARYGKKNELKLAVLSADDANPYFGEMAVVDGTPRSATAVALDDCVLGEVPGHSLSFYFNEHPELIIGMLRRMSGRLRVLTDEFEDACRVVAWQQAAKKPESEWIKNVKKYVEFYDEVNAEAALYAAGLSKADKYAADAAPVAGVDEQFTGGSSVMEAKKIAAGTVIFKKGDVENCMYDILSGSIGVYLDYGEPTEKKLTTLTADKNRFLGEMGLIEAAPRSATAVAETDCMVVTVKAEQMNSYFLNDPDVLLAVMRQMSDRTRSLTKDYMEAVKTIAENDKYDKNGESKPEWILNNMKKFASIWNGFFKSNN